MQKIITDNIAKGIRWAKRIVNYLKGYDDVALPSLNTF